MISVRNDKVTSDNSALCDRYQLREGAAVKMLDNKYGTDINNGSH